MNSLKPKTTQKSVNNKNGVYLIEYNNKNESTTAIQQYGWILTLSQRRQEQNITTEVYSYKFKRRKTKT